MLKLNKKGQVIMTEYVILIGVVILVITAMQAFNQRGVNSVIKESFDRLGNQTDADIKTDRAGIPVGSGNERSVAMDISSKTNYTMSSQRVGTDAEGRPVWQQTTTYNGKANNYSGADQYELTVYGGYSEELAGAYLGGGGHSGGGGFGGYDEGPGGGGHTGGGGSGIVNPDDGSNGH